ncbi:aldo/keto reductase [Vibrio tritonius]|uniref:Aldo/keto reductase n=1 Tax=Vibrio tritonius TaxID=1435069 RepID=A0ABS7YQT7_9VIBR|nr:aldo/keto reductase [Vibrio tritonius]MCA2018038.1 aldo/keto reductase [Vibrio tritonius]
MEFITLNNGVQMPLLGYGVYQVTPDECERCVTDAINVGYRLIDTAQAYYNEEGLGNAIAKSSVPRDELFITTKVWVSNSGEEKAVASIDESLKKLQSDYIDLLLIHQPFGDYYGTYRAMEKAYKAGKVRAIGVSNFFPDRFVDLAENVEIKPAVNQMETHVFNQQMNTREVLTEYETTLESWGPFAEGKNDFFTNEVLKHIGEQYNKSVAQVALRFLVQQGIVAIPKSVRKERMAENLDVFDFVLSQDEIELIKALDQKESLFLSHTDPASVKFILEYDKTMRP